MGNIVLGQYPQYVVKYVFRLLSDMPLVFEFGPDLTQMNTPFDMPDGIKSGTAEPGNTWVICAEKDKALLEIIMSLSLQIK